MGSSAHMGLSFSQCASSIETARVQQRHDSLRKGQKEREENRSSQGRSSAFPKSLGRGYCRELQILISPPSSQRFLECEG